MEEAVNRKLLPTMALSCTLAWVPAHAGDDGRNDERGRPEPLAIDVGARPHLLVGDMADGALKTKLQRCAGMTMRKSELSIGHRGAPMRFAEHTRESYIAAARMGAGILECDVTFTRDKVLVCRHAQNDLHSTTNILAIPDLAAKCTRPFRPATFDTAGGLVSPASAECRASDITLAEFKRLRGKMPAANARARTVEEYIADPASGTLMTHAESIKLFKQLGVKMIPELKRPVVGMPFDGFSRQAFAQQLVDEYKRAGVPPSHVFLQSFDRADVLYWIAKEPRFGRQAVLLDGARSPQQVRTMAELAAMKAQGINIWAPPLFSLLDDAKGRIVASQAARNARAADLDILTWTVERSGTLGDGDDGYYYQGFGSAVTRDGDVMRVIDALARDVGVRGIFTDWTATVTYYASCMDP